MSVLPTSAAAAVIIIIVMYIIITIIYTEKFDSEKLDDLLIKMEQENLAVDHRWSPFGLLPYSEAC